MSSKRILFPIVIILFLFFFNLLFGQISDNQFYLRFAGGTSKLIGGEEDYSTFRALGNFNMGYFFTKRLGVELDAGYGFVTIRDKGQALEVLSHIMEDSVFPIRPHSCPILPIYVSIWQKIAPGFHI